MSLVCHTIVSRYTPQQRDPITQATESDVDIWQTEPSFGSAQRLHSRPAPSFVPASLEYDEYGMPKASRAGPSQHPKSSKASRDVSTWYRNLTSRGRRINPDRDRQSVDTQASPPVVPIRHSSFRATSPHTGGRTPLRRRNWFSSHPSHAHTSHSKPSALTDLLTRNPPPLPSEPAFKPPVFLPVGPSNRGFAMLERKGWQEGEGLGSARVERYSKGGPSAGRALRAAFGERKTEQPMLGTRSCDSVVTAPRQANPEVIDLTLSDCEEEPTQEVADLTACDSDQEDEDVADVPNKTASSPPAPHGTTLLTPIATTLKADRLGIGLKPSRHGRLLKRKAVTHTGEAIAAHIRAGNQAHKERARHGRGSRGFARINRKEQQERMNMLGYMNT